MSYGGRCAARVKTITSHSFTISTDSSLRRHAGGAAQINENGPLGEGERAFAHQVLIVTAMIYGARYELQWRL